MVLIPRIEYRSQLVVLSPKECNALFAQVRIFLKHKLKFPKSTPNSMLNSKLTNGFNDFAVNMIHSKLQHFANIINGDPSLSLLTKTTEIRLKQLQEYFWLYDNPLICWPISLNKFHHDNFLGNIISFYLQSNLSFSNTSANVSKFKIKGGKTPLQTIISWKKKWINSLRHKSLLFLDQLICEGNFLIHFRDISTHINNNHHTVKGSYPQYWQMTLK
jgi:hypothetical protein